MNSPPQELALTCECAVCSDYESTDSEAFQWMICVEAPEASPHDGEGWWLIPRVWLPQILQRECPECSTVQDDDELLDAIERALTEVLPTVKSSSGAGGSSTSSFSRISRWLVRDAAHVVGDVESLLIRCQQEQRMPRAKLGIDPTAPHLHIGHAVAINKLREFQDAGFHAILIIGDGTATVGDPTGRNLLRPPLSREQALENGREFLLQAGPLLNTEPEHLTVLYNSQWIDKLGTAGMFSLLSSMTLAQALERDDFSKRFEEGKPLSMLEMTYPLLQALDSVHIKADIELGGSDQLWNIMLGKTLQKQHGVEHTQIALTMPILRGTDGTRKMSKTFDNHIALQDTPEQMWGRTMSISDDLLDEWWTLVGGGESPVGMGPRDSKMLLAQRVVERFHGEEQAQQAKAQWSQCHVNKTLPEKAGLEKIIAKADDAGTIHLPALLQQAFHMSKTQARQALKEGSVRVDGVTLSGEMIDISIDVVDNVVLSHGKRNHIHIQSE